MLAAGCGQSAAGTGAVTPTQPPGEHSAGEGATTSFDCEFSDQQLAADPVYAAEQMLYAGDMAGAQRALEGIVDATPKNWSPQRTEGHSVHVAAWSMHELMPTCLENALSGVSTRWIGPSYSKAFYMLAFIAIESGDFAAATLYLDEAVTLEPDHPLILSEIGLLLGQQQRYEEAVDVYLRAANARPSAPVEQRALGLRGAAIALIELDDLDRAERLLHESLALEPDSQVAQRELEYIASLRAGGAKVGTGIVPAE